MLVFIEKLYLHHYKWIVWGKEVLSRDIQKIHVSLAKWQLLCHFITAMKQNW